MSSKDLINSGPIYVNKTTGESFTPPTPISPISGDPIEIKRYPGFDYSAFKKNLPEGMSIEETQQFGGPQYAQGQFQSGWEQTAYFVPRVAVKFASEISKLPGYLGGLAVWGSNGFAAKDISDMVDNEWIQAIDSAEQSIKDKAFPVFKTYKESTGSFSEQVFNPAFWATEGADGVGFFLSMLVPGQLLKTAKIGEGISMLVGSTAKLLKPGTKLASQGIKSIADISTTGAKAAKYVNGGLSATINTLYEAGAEAGEGYQKIIEQLSHDYDPATGEDRGPKINPDTGLQYTEQELRQVAGTNAANIMKSNFGILLASNLIMEQLLFHSFNNTLGLNKAVKSGIIKSGDKLALNTEKISGLQKGLKVASSVGTGIISEGLWEEGAQAAVQDYFNKRATGEEKEPSSVSELFGSMINTYLDNFTNSIDAQKSMLLGALLGSVAGGISTYNTNKNLQKQLFGTQATNPGVVSRFFGKRAEPKTEGLINLLNDNLTNRYDDITSLTLKNEKGEYIYNNDGTLKFDEKKVIEYVQDKIKDKTQLDNLAIQAQYGNKEAYDFLKEVSDFKYMLPFLNQEEGLVALKNHINDLAVLDHERQIKFFGEDKAQSIEKIKNDLLEKSEKYEKVVKRLQQHHINSNLYNRLNYEEVDKSAGERFIARVLAGKQQSYFNQTYLPKRILTLQAENAGLNSELATEKQQIDLNNKYIEQYQKDLESSNKLWNNLTDIKYLQSELDKFITADRELNKKIDSLTKLIETQSGDPKTEFTNKIFAQTQLQDSFFDLKSNRDRSIVHQGSIKVTLKDAEGNPITHSEIVTIKNIDPKTKKETTSSIAQDVELKYKVISKSAAGNLIVERLDNKARTIIKPDGTIMINGKAMPFSYEILETGIQAKLNNSNNTVRLAYSQALADYEDKLHRLTFRMTAIEERINILNKNIESALNNSHTKSGKLKRFYLGTKDGQRVYMDALEMTITVKTLKEKNKQLSDNAEKISQRVESLKVELEKLRNLESDNIEFIKETINSFAELVKNTSEIYFNTKELIDSKERYLRALFSRLKGFHTAFFNTFEDQFTNIINDLRKSSNEKQISEFQSKINNLKDDEFLYDQLLDSLDNRKTVPIQLLQFRDEINQLYNNIITNKQISTEEQQAQIFELITNVKQAINEFFDEDSAKLMNSTFEKNIESLNAKIAITEQELQDLYQIRKESFDNRNKSFKILGRNTRILKRVYEIYTELFKQELDTEFDVETSQKKSITNIEHKLPDIKKEIDKSNQEIDSNFDEVPKHIFSNSGFDFLHSTGNFNISNSDDYFRWMGYVYTTNDFSAENTPRHYIKTYTYDQILNLDPSNVIRNQIRFYTGPELGELTVEEIGKLSSAVRNSINKYLENDLKIVVVNANKTDVPYLVSENGTESTTNKNSNTYILFSQLPLPEVIRSTGFDVFTYDKRLSAIKQRLAQDKDRRASCRERV